MTINIQSRGQMTCGPITFNEEKKEFVTSLFTPDGRLIATDYFSHFNLDTVQFAAEDKLREKYHYNFTYKGEEYDVIQYFRGEDRVNDITVYAEGEQIGGLSEFMGTKSLIKFFVENILDDLLEQ